MSNYLYNGVELPELPTWDKTTYPVAVISTVLDAASSMYAGAKYILTLGKTFLWLNGKCYVSAITGVYRYDGSAWVWHYGSGTTYNQDIIVEGFFEALWSRTDIPTADGGVYLAGSEPEAVGGGGDEGEGDDGTGGDGGDGSEGDGEDDGGGNDGDEEGGSGSGSQDESINTARRKGFISGFVAGLSVRGVFDRKTIAEDAEAQAIASAEVVGASFSLYNPKTVRRHSFILGFIAGTNVKGILAKKKIDPEPEAAYYLYNGVPLPNFPENHDEFFAKIQDKVDAGNTEAAAYLTDYPYMVVFYQKVYREYQLYYFRLPQMYDSEYNEVGRPYDDPEGDNHQLRYRINLTSQKWRDSINSSLFAFNDELIWSNHDILNNEDGSVYFAASEPTPAYEFPSVVRNPQCSYNGNVYPELPEWDKETYPYAFIADGGKVSGVQLCVLPVKPMVRLNTDGNPILYSNENFEYLWFNLNSDYLQWWATPTAEYWNEPYSGNSYGDFQTYDFLLWSNFDACDSEGTVYLAASEPIPVYE